MDGTRHFFDDYGAGDGVEFPFEFFGHRLGLSVEELLDRVWGYTYGDTSTVTVHVRRLREKIELDPSDPALVLTVRGAGYRFDGGVTVDG